MPPRDSLTVDDLLKELDDLPTGSSATQKRSQGAVGNARFASSPASTSYSVANSTPASKAPATSAASTASHSAGIKRPESMSLRHAASAEGGKTALDKLLADIDDLDLPSSGACAPSTSQPARSTPGNSTGRPSLAAKCMGLFIGGSGKQRGRNGSAVGTALCCDNLRCTKCDFKVIWFRDQEWDSSVDYLFFRNNFPTDNKLAPMLLYAQGSCAYCCQCSWKSTTNELLVDFGGDLRWVCAGHSS